MRTLVLAVACAASIGGPCAAQVGHRVSAFKARNAGYQIITEQQALDAARRFLGDPGAKLAVRGLYYDDVVGRFGLYYNLDLDPGSPNVGTVYVNATTRAVMSLLSPEPSAQNLDPDHLRQSTIPRDRAREIALAFLRDHYPPFAARRWKPVPDYFSQRDDSYDFSWYPLLSDAGAMDTWDLTVTVDGVTGKVTGFCTPSEHKVTAPVTPRISLAQARAIAARYASYDPAVVPFDPIDLQVLEFPQTGIQRLEWHLMQRPDPIGDPSRHEGLYIDAMTGEPLGRDVALGGGPPVTVARPGARKPPAIPNKPRIGLRLNTANGRPLPNWPAPVVKHGVLWVRAELLRPFGAEVRGDLLGLRVQSGARTVEGSAVGAHRRQDGWWVPLRRVAGALGWSVSWSPEARAAVVNPGPPRASAGN